jgi:hypothetical protein
MQTDISPVLAADTRDHLLGVAEDRAAAVAPRLPVAETVCEVGDAVAGKPTVVEVLMPSHLFTAHRLH